MKYSNLLRVNWSFFVKCKPKSSQLKKTKTETTSVCVHWIYLIHKFHNLSWITEINELFHDILIYWDAPVCVCCFYIHITVYYSFSSILCWCIYNTYEHFEILNKEKYLNIYVHLEQICYMLN